MTIVLCPGQSVSSLLAAANSSCPACRGTLRPWGNARWRVVRSSAGDWRYRPSRLRCRSCGVTQVVLPSEVLVRRRDAVVVVGRAWRCFAAGAGARRVARLLDLPMGTVRGWLRRLRARAAVLYRPRARARAPGNQNQPLRRALAFVVAAAIGAGWEAEGDIWRFVAYRSAGRLLFNTSWP